MQLKKRAYFGFRICQLNVRFMTGRGREVADLMREKKVDVICVQGTLCKGNRAKEISDGYELYISGTNKQGRYGVGLILSGELKNALIDVHRKNDRIIRLKMRRRGEIMNIISAYAPQVGCTEDDK
ncbi:craniofacial development protein 2-like [Palaemon carinicauda]|uniref:craniofacial development protein 2-like n=1 Tax=Palaemon carinicauda TaxID=392227 RepID=UPI0035B62D49